MAQNIKGPPELPQTTLERVRQAVVGRAKDFRHPSVRHTLALIPFLAWVGLGADGLSSSAYGPEEAYRTLGDHTYLAVLLAVATTLTIAVIAYSYSRIIEQFPTGGGGYLVASQLLGDHLGLASGTALLVDYVLTIAVSIASGGDAVFSLLPVHWQIYKLPAEYAAIVGLTIMNLRGVKESVTLLTPIFLTFVATHIILIGGGLLAHAPDVPAMTREVSGGFRQGAAQLGLWGMLLLLVRAYSMGAGTYTGIEAVSNGLGILREPRVETGKRTMLYMAVSLAVTASGLLVCYMLFHVEPQAGRTLNAVLAEKFAKGFRPGGLPIGPIFVILAIGVEAVLLLVAAQTGFIGGPRVMANMAADAWLPRRFAGLSDRLTMQNGILLMGLAATLIMSYTRGAIGVLVVMYSIDVFVTFSLAQLGMVRFWRRRRTASQKWTKYLLVHATGFVLCAGILVIMILEKFLYGGWVTILITAAVFAVCLAIRRHYRHVTKLVRALDREFGKLPGMLRGSPAVPEFDPRKPTAIFLVGGYGGLGLHIFFSNLRLFPHSFHNFVFASVGAVDSEFFKRQDLVEATEQETRQSLQQFVDVATKAGKPAKYAFRLGTDVTEEASELCVELSRQYPGAVVFAGTLVFEQPHWYDRILHNETAYAIQRRLKFAGVPVVILPLLLREPKKAAKPLRKLAKTGVR
jgi:amino acid transporter